jgi:hypothetical protein
MTSKLFTVAAFAVALAASQAQASHVWMTDFTINGIALDSSSGFTDPTFNVLAGEDLTFKFGVYGSSDTVTFTFVADGGSTLAAPAPFSFVYSGGDPSSSPEYFTFTRSFATPGVFDGRLRANLNGSSPDYVLHSSSQVDGVDLPFRVNVASAVPEPASLALMTLGGFGMAAGAWRRKRKGAAAQAA